MTARDENGFLQRWSRRKQEAARRTAAPAMPAAATPDREAAARAQVDEIVRHEAETQEREAVLARLPKLEDLTAETDFRLFMHPLVPAALRSAALARMWTLDPAIRDFVGPARDYAWDWNVPGGVPGGGPAPSLADVESMLSRLTARLDAETAREAGGADEGQVPSIATPSIEAPSAEAPPAETSPPVAGASTATPAAMPALSMAAVVPVEAGAPPQNADPPGVPSRRRHGGATPL